VRGKICADYYAMGDYFRQKDYRLKRLIVRPVTRRRIVSKERSGIETLSQTRQISVAYYLEYQGTRHRVCHSFFLKTLCLSDRAVMTDIDGKTVSDTFSKMDCRGRQPSVNKTDDEHRQTVKYHILSFPTVVESHYCRKDTQRLYLDSKLTIARMYELYVEKCKEFYDEYQPVSATVLFCSVL